MSRFGVMQFGGRDKLPDAVVRIGPCQLLGGLCGTYRSKDAAKWTPAPKSPLCSRQLGKDGGHTRCVGGRAVAPGIGMQPDRPFVPTQVQDVFSSLRSDIFHQKQQTESGHRSRRFIRNPGFPLLPKDCQPGRPVSSHTCSAACSELYAPGLVCGIGIIVTSKSVQPQRKDLDWLPRGGRRFVKPRIFGTKPDLDPALDQPSLQQVRLPRLLFHGREGKRVINC